MDETSIINNLKNIVSVSGTDSGTVSALNDAIEYIEFQGAVIGGMKKVLDNAVDDINKYCRSCKLCKKYNPYLICEHDGPGDGCFFYKGCYPSQEKAARERLKPYIGRYGRKNV